MSAQKGKPSKRALPSVPLLRSGSADFINTAALRSGTRIRPTVKETTSTPTTPEKVIIRKSSAPAGVLRHQLLKNSPLAARRRLLEQRRDSANSTSSSNDNSPFSSRRGSKESLPIIKDVDDDNYRSNDRKIARVLPMSPAFLTNEGISAVTTPTLKNLKDFQTPLTNTDKKEKFHTPEYPKQYSGTPRNIEVIKTPVTTPHTPYQIPSIADEDSCSIVVAVRVRPLSQR